MSLYLYLDRRTFVHRLHPTVKLASMACFFLAAFVSERLALQLPLALGVGLLLIGSGSLPNVSADSLPC